MSLPFGSWQAGNLLVDAVEYEEEEDELEEEENTDTVVKYHVISTQDGSDLSDTELTCDTFVLSIGNAACAFVATYADLPTNPIAEITQQNGNKMGSKKKKCYIYQSNDLIIGQCNSFVAAKDCKNWTKTLFRTIKPRNALILSHSTVTQLPDVHSTDVLRCLPTSNYTCNQTVPLLEEGVLLKGVPAACVSHCEQIAVPAVVYVNFMESHFIDVFTLKTFQPVIENENLKGKLKSVSPQALFKRLQLFDGIAVADNNLYI